MSVHLLKFETYGVKNISEKISLDFSNKTINSKSVKFTKTKAIFGGNGAGKSAIINSFYIYSNLFNIRNYLSQQNTQNHLYNLCNKNKKEIFMKAYFSSEEDDKIRYFSHEIKLGLSNGIFYIKNEIYKEIKGRLLIDDYSHVIFETKDGELKYFYDDLLFDRVTLYTKNLLSRMTFLSTAAIDFLEIDANVPQSGFINIYKTFDINIEKCVKKFRPLMRFLSKLKVRLETDEANEINKIPYNDFLVKEELISKNTKDETVYLLKTSNYDVVSKSEFDNYLNLIDKLTEFIKIFKPNLVNIIIDKKVDGKTYKCNKIFNYGSYKVDIEFESTGIKKLVEIFTYLDSAMNGDIVFIDELDSNVSPVFLNEFIQFFNDEAKGQLCFTSHNLEPLSILKSKSHSIDFLGETGKLIPWVTNGNYSPRSLYVEGMIHDSPFNFDSSDFYKVFDTIYKE